MRTCTIQDEGQLLQECRRGSHDAFEVLVNRHMKDAYRIAVGLVGCREDAMELSQEAFYRSFKNIGLLKPDSPGFIRSCGTSVLAIFANSGSAGPARFPRLTERN